MSSYRKENPGVSDSYYIKCYINGLREDIKHYLKPLKPLTLYDAVQYAKDMEKASLAQQATRKFSSTSSYPRNNSSGQNTFQRNKQTEPFVPRKENEAKPVAR
jgi:hypothetical protein